MLRIFWTSKSAMSAISDKMDAISVNMDNVDTVSYKKVDVSFKDLVNESLNKAGYPTSKNSTINNTNSTGTGVRTSAWNRDNTQGDLVTTDKSTDLAIDGEGYFQFTTPNKDIVYSRAGKLQVDLNGRITDLNGNVLNITYDKGMNEKNAGLTDTNIKVNEKGVLSTLKNGVSQNVGTIQLYSAVGDNAFRSIGGNSFVAQSNATVYKVNNSSIRQGYYEGSNVDISTEMADMIVTQRAFELSSKGIKVADDMWGIANNLASK